MLKGRTKKTVVPLKYSYMPIIFYALVSKVFSFQMVLTHLSILKMKTRSMLEKSMYWSALIPSVDAT